MSEKITIGRSYAKAIFLLAKNKNDYDLWSELLNSLCKIMEDKSVISLVTNPIISIKNKFDFIIQIFNNSLDACHINFIYLLLKNNRLLCINEISELYHIYMEKEQNLLKVDVISAAGINKESRDNLTLILSKKFNKNVFIKFSVDSNLIGGVVIKVQDDVYDGTLKESLLNFKNLLIS